MVPHYQLGCVVLYLCQIMFRIWQQVIHANKRDNYKIHNVEPE